MFNGECPPGYIPDNPNNPDCCRPASSLPQPKACPPGDVAGSGGGCPSGYGPDPNAPGCCAPLSAFPLPQPQPCPPGDIASVGGQCAGGYAPDPTSPGCCAPAPSQAVEACFCCPSLQDLQNALKGLPNACISSGIFQVPDGCNASATGGQYAGSLGAPMQTQSGFPALQP